jgi:hypothetical protein
MMSLNSSSTRLNLAASPGSAPLPNIGSKYTQRLCLCVVCVTQCAQYMHACEAVKQSEAQQQEHSMSAMYSLCTEECHYLCHYLLCGTTAGVKHASTFCVSCTKQHAAAHMAELYKLLHKLYEQKKTPYLYLIERV